MNKEERISMRNKAEKVCDKATYEEIGKHFGIDVENIKMKHVRKYAKYCKKKHYTDALWKVFSEQYGEGYDYDFEEFKGGRIVRLVKTSSGATERVFIKDLEETPTLFWKLANKATSFIGKKDFRLPDNPDLEKALNLLMFGMSFKVSWSEYFIFFANGRQIFKNLFNKPSLTAIINLYCIIYAVQISGTADPKAGEDTPAPEGDYDNIFFRKEILRMMPYILPVEIFEKIGFISKDTVADYSTPGYIFIQKIFASAALPALVTYLESVLQKSGVLEGTKMMIRRAYRGT